MINKGALAKLKEIHRLSAPGEWHWGTVRQGRSEQTFIVIRSEGWDARRGEEEICRDGSPLNYAAIVAEHNIMPELIDTAEKLSLGVRSAAEAIALIPGVEFPEELKDALKLAEHIAGPIL